MKDWTGNKNSIYKILGASNHTDKERENHDYYATEPKAIDILLETGEKFTKKIFEPSAGEGHLAERLKEYGYIVITNDIVQRNYKLNYVMDFLKFKPKKLLNIDIITNPPYKYAKEFIEHSLSIIENGNKVAMFLKIQFLEGKERKKLFQNFQPKIIYVSSSRILCAKNAEFERMKAGGGSAVAYAWFIWEKGYKGETIIKWIN